MAEYIVNDKNNVYSTLYGCKEDVLGNHIHKKLVNLTKETFKNKVEEKLKGDNYENNRIIKNI